MCVPMPKPSIGACFCKSRSKNIFVDAAAGEDRGFLQTAVVEYTAHFEGVIGQVSAIQTHAFDLDAVARQFRREADDLLCRGFGIVGIDQQNHVFRQGP
jgi:hypothetical protein